HADAPGKPGLSGRPPASPFDSPQARRRANLPPMAPCTSNRRLASCIVAVLFSLPLLAGEASSHNTLTPGEQAAGWRLLFDGSSTDGWRSFKGDSFPERGWIVENGTLRHVRNGRGGDIVTREQFVSYEFRFEWSIEPGG